MRFSTFFLRTQPFSGHSLVGRSGDMGRPKISCGTLLRFLPPIPQT
jgi:hypothetical protein